VNCDLDGCDFLNYRYCSAHVCICKANSCTEIISFTGRRRLQTYVADEILFPGGLWTKTEDLV
jgi:hypothetical protein